MGLKKEQCHRFDNTKARCDEVIQDLTHHYDSGGYLGG